MSDLGPFTGLGCMLFVHAVLLFGAGAAIVALIWWLL